MKITSATQISAGNAQLRLPPAELPNVIAVTTPNLHTDLQDCTIKLLEEIPGPTMDRGQVIDRLLDLRNLGRGRDLGLELTVDDMLESLPAGRSVSSEWWLSCLSELADHANFLAAGYPPVTPELIAA